MTLPPVALAHIGADAGPMLMLALPNRALVAESVRAACRRFYSRAEPFEGAKHLPSLNACVSDTFDGELVKPKSADGSASGVSSPTRRALSRRFESGRQPRVTALPPSDHADPRALNVRGVVVVVTASTGAQPPRAAGGSSRCEAIARRMLPSARTRAASTHALGSSRRSRASPASCQTLLSTRSRPRVESLIDPTFRSTGEAA